jgi:ABC-type transport system involved in cytochrome c biogenesis permease subunit
MMENLVTFSDLLSWLMGVGAIIVTNWFASWVLEEIPQWHTLPSKFRQITMYVLAGVLAIGAYLITQNEQIVTLLAPYVKILLGLAATYTTGQYFHSINPKRMEG